MREDDHCKKCFKCSLEEGLKIKLDEIYGEDNSYLNKNQNIPLFSPFEPDNKIRILPEGNNTEIF